MCLSGSCFSGNVYLFLFLGYSHILLSFIFQPNLAQPDEWAFEPVANCAQSSLPKCGEGVRVRMCVPMCLCVHACACVSVCARVDVCLCVHLCTSVCICVFQTKLQQRLLSCIKAQAWN